MAKAFFNVALHTAEPPIGAYQTTYEATYDGYERQRVEGREIDTPEGPVIALPRVEFPESRSSGTEIIRAASISRDDGTEGLARVFRVTTLWSPLPVGPNVMPRVLDWNWPGGEAETDLAAENARLRREKTEARAALEPFAKWIEDIDDCPRPDNDDETVSEYNATFPSAPTLGDLRRARAIARGEPRPTPIADPVRTLAAIRKEETDES
jgi:hypothetical protein